MEYWKQELYHHGILGMKWGKRNGPPYPLGSSDHSVSERKAGWRRSLGGRTNEHLYDRNEAKRARTRYWQDKGRTVPTKKTTSTRRNTDIKKSATNSTDSNIDKEKLIKAGKIAAGVALTAIGTYAVYKAYQQYGIRADARRHVDIALSTLKNKDIELDLLLGKDPITGRVSVAKVNPKKAKDITFNLGQQRYAINKALEDSKVKGDRLAKAIGKKDYDKLINDLKELDKKTKGSYDLADAMNLLDEEELLKYVKTGVFG